MYYLVQGLGNDVCNVVLCAYVFQFDYALVAVTYHVVSKVDILWTFLGCQVVAHKHSQCKSVCICMERLTCINPLIK